MSRRSKRIIIAVVAGATLSATLLFGPVVTMWVKLFFCRAEVPFIYLVGMRLRGSPMEALGRTYIASKKAALDVSMEQLETHALAGGDAESVVKAMTQASIARIDLPFKMAAAIDLAARQSGVGVVELVQGSTIPRVVTIPKADWPVPYLETMTRDGVLIRYRISVTVRMRIETHVGGATEQTLVARIQSMSAALLGSAQTCTDVFRNLAQWDGALMQANTDAGTAYEVLSIDTTAWRAGEAENAASAPAGR